MVEAKHATRLFGTLVVALVLRPLCLGAQDADRVFVDPRDGREYPVVQLGGSEWFARNLAYAAEWSYCYDDDPAMCERYGRMYTWEVALGACPSGWHLSTEYEWQMLELAVGMDPRELMQRGNRGTVEGDRLKPGGGTGFAVLYGGWRDWEDVSFEAAGSNAALWTATESDIDAAWHRDIDDGDSFVYRSPVDKRYALSVRCVANRSDAPPPNQGQ